MRDSSQRLGGGALRSLTRPSVVQQRRVSDDTCDPWLRKGTCVGGIVRHQPILSAFDFDPSVEITTELSFIDEKPTFSLIKLELI